MFRSKNKAPFMKDREPNATQQQKLEKRTLEGLENPTLFNKYFEGQRTKRYEAAET